MAHARVTRGQVIEDSPATLLARVEDRTGAYIVPADVSGIAVKVIDIDTGETVATPTAVVADSIYNTLQTDNRWRVDKLGYNVAIQLEGECFPAGGKTYRVEVLVTPLIGSAIPLLWELSTVNMYGS